MGISKNRSLLTAATKLRHHAEERLRTRMIEFLPPRSEDETRRLVHELEVHQIELEMQNAELRQARDEVESALEKYTSLYDFAPVGYITLTRTGTISAVNLAGAGLLGGVRSRLRGRRFELFITVADRPVFTAFLGKVLTCQIKESCEVTLLKEEEQSVIVQIEAMATASGQEFRLAMIDITGRRRAEDALAGKQHELEKLNGSLELRIVQDVDDARRKDQMLILQDRRAVLGEMINNIAHQWRQPLNILGLYLQELPFIYDSAELNREYLETFIDKSMQLIVHMSQTIDDFRHFFRSDKERVTFDVNRIIEQTVTLIEKSFEDRKISIVLQIEGCPMVSGYPNEYAQVLLNILMNARDALIGRTVDDARISIRAFVEEGATVVTITDNAGGIANAIIDKIFDPYFTTKGPDKGTGIGLFMSKTIIEKNMGGKLTVRNTADGTEFSIRV